MENILELHDKILKNFDLEFSQLSQKKSRLDELNKILKSGTISEKNSIKYEYSVLSKNINDIESGSAEAQYILDTEDIIKEYLNLINTPIRINFMSKKNTVDNDSRAKLINRYLDFAKKYITIPKKKVVASISSCVNCNINLKTHDEFLLLCPNCGYTEQQLITDFEYEENTRINPLQRYFYHTRTHFGDSIKKFQGKQNTTIDEKVYTDIYKKIQLHEIPLESFTKEHLYEFLKMTGHTNHFEDSVLIYNVITNKPSPDISHLDQSLFEMFDKMEPVYARIKPPNRKNFLNGQYVLFKFLQLLKYPCREEDFSLLRIRDTVIDLDKSWRKICDELSWTFIPTV